MMDNWHQDCAFVVVVVHGKADVSRTTRPNASEAERYTKRLLEQGVPAANIRVYRTRLVRATLPASHEDSVTTD
jgi:acetyl esterase/lipase